MIQGEKIRLRDWKIADLELYQFWNTGHQKWMDFDGPYYPKLTPSQLIEKVSQYKIGIKENDWEIPRKRLLIADLENDKLLGKVSWYWQSKETHWMSIGIVIFDEQNWGKGIGLDALRLWVNYLFQVNQKIARLDLRTWSGNHGMMALGEKLVFEKYPYQILSV